MRLRDAITSSMWETTFHVIILAVMLVGLFGLIFPILPGLVIIWLAALVYGLVGGFTWQNGFIFAVMTVMMLIGNVIDNFIMGVSARKTGRLLDRDRPRICPGRGWQHLLPAFRRADRCAARFVRLRVLSSQRLAQGAGIYQGHGHWLRLVGRGPRRAWAC